MIKNLDGSLDRDVISLYSGNIKMKKFFTFPSETFQEKLCGVTLWLNNLIQHNNLFYIFYKKNIIIILNVV